LLSNALSKSVIIIYSTLIFNTGTIVSYLFLNTIPQKNQNRGVNKEYFNHKILQGDNFYKKYLYE
jgi:hypothetical protein